MNFGSFLIKYINNKGYSLFSRSFIPKNTIIFDHYKDPNTSIININQLETTFKNMDILSRIKFLKYSFIIQDKIFYPNNNFDSKIFFIEDNNSSKRWFINHSLDFNVLCDKSTDGKCITVKDININDELTENFNNYCNNEYYDKLCQEYLGYKFSNLTKKLN